MTADVFAFRRMIYRCCFAGFSTTQQIDTIQVYCSDAGAETYDYRARRCVTVA